MASIDEFLTLYKTYEGLLWDNEKDYKTIEETADNLTSNRMRITRQMRNYLSHNADPAFLSVSEEQIKMLKILITEEQSEMDLLRDHLYPLKRGSCEEGMPLSDILAQMVKQKFRWIPVLSGTKLLGLAEIWKLTSLYLKNPDSSLERKSYGPYGKDMMCFPPEKPMKEISGYLGIGKPICCTSDGTGKGQFIGLYNENK